MDDRPEQRPEGRLIAVAQKQARLSQREAARRAGMSEARWRNIVSGYQTVSAGMHAPVRGPADTIARMSQVVGVTAEQLIAAGRDDAATELRDLPPLPEPKRQLSAQEIAERLDEHIAYFRRQEEERAREREEYEERVRRLEDKVRRLGGDSG